MAEKIYSIRYDVRGDERKRLVKAMTDHLDTFSTYLGVPSCAYRVENYTVSRDGLVSFDSSVSRKEAVGLLRYLGTQGFEPRNADLPAAAAGECPAEAPTGADSAEGNGQMGLTIGLPVAALTEEGLPRLRRILDSKAGLIKKALNADRLEVRIEGDAVCFPWWDDLPMPEETQAYTAFIAAICGMAKEAKRVTATEREVGSEKYAFRGFLLRLGFIGVDSKEQRKILLKNLSGSSAFPDSEKAAAFSAAQKAKREAAKAETEVQE